MANATPLQITRGAVNLVVGALAQAGWTKSHLSLYRAGKILDQLETMFEGDKPPAEGDKEAMKVWVMNPCTVGLLPKEIETVKECLKYHVKEGHIAPSKHYISIADALGLEDDSEE